MVEYREFGRTKVSVSAMGMGTYYDISWMMASRFFRHRNNVEQKISAIRTGIELGINLIDTAEMYETEPLIAEAIKDCSRENLFIATKVSPTHLSYYQILKAAKRSLDKLKCSYIDLYQLHYPSPIVPIEKTMRAMETLVDDGKIRYIGVSNFSLSQMKKAEEALSKYPLASNQMEYSLKARAIEADILPYCERRGIAILAYRPLAHGALANPSGKLKSVVDEISQKHDGKTPAQIALNWILNRSRVVFAMPRASSTNRVKENVGATSWALDSSDLTNLARLY
jgi:diketogulonate reductase-like aldo/keto reductase